MNVLVYTSLFPNGVWPGHGVFIKERVARVARLPGVALRVMAPVPWVPPIPIGWRTVYGRVPARETIDALDVTHPRYFLVPKIATRLHGDLLARGTLPAARAVRREFPFAVIDAHYAYPDGYAAVAIGRALGVPVVVSARGSDVNLFATLPSIRPLLTRTLLAAHEVIAVSAALREAIVALGVPAERITVIPNGVDASRFHPAPRAAARARLSLPDGPLLLSVGHLVPNKGFDRLIRAARRLEEGTPPLRPMIAIVGGGPEEARLRTLARSLGMDSRVRFAGAVAHAELPHWYAAADLFCLATEREGWPNAVTEATACGLPVVAPRVGGIPEIIEATPGVELGILTPADRPFDESAFADAIRTALGRAWDHAAIARTGATRTWEEAARATSVVLARAVERGGTA